MKQAHSLLIEIFAYTAVADVTELFFILIKKNPLGTKLALVIYAGLSTDSCSWRVCIIIDVATAEIPQERCTIYMLPSVELSWV